MDTTVCWKRVAQAIRDIVDEHGGVIVMTRIGLCEAVLEEDPGLGEYPPAVMSTIAEHITCGLEKRAGLISRAYQGIDKSVLLIFDKGMSEQAARDHLEADELSDDVQIALFERQLAKVSA